MPPYSSIWQWLIANSKNFPISSLRLRPVSEAMASIWLASSSFIRMENILYPSSPFLVGDFFMINLFSFMFGFLH